MRKYEDNIEIDREGPRARFFQLSRETPKPSITTPENPQIKVVLCQNEVRGGIYILTRREPWQVQREHCPGGTESRIPNLSLSFLEISNLEHYREFEVSKYKTFSKCSTHGYYILKKSSI